MLRRKKPGRENQRDALDIELILLPHQHFSKFKKKEDQTGWKLHFQKQADEQEQEQICKKPEPPPINSKEKTLSSEKSTVRI